MDIADIEDRFSYHPSIDNQHAKYVAIRSEIKEVAFTINELCPTSREKSLAVTALESAVFWANAAIARHGV
jgi:hypothetical protein